MYVKKLNKSSNPTTSSDQQTTTILFMSYDCSFCLLCLIFVEHLPNNYEKDHIILYVYIYGYNLQCAYNMIPGGFLSRMYHLST